MAVVSTAVVSLLVLACYVLLILPVINQQQVAGTPRYEVSAASESPLQPATASKPNGAFVIKTKRAEHAAKTLCALTHFFNAEKQYPVRIFVDTKTVAAETLESLRNVSGGADLRVVADPQQRWRQLPEELTAEQRDKVLDKCDNFNAPMPLCTHPRTPLGYVHMNWWNYAVMPYEPELQQFDYLISFDADAFLTQPVSHIDPFRLMRDNNLDGIFNIEAFQSGDIARGIQEAAEEYFPERERLNRTVGKRPWFDDKGQWRAAPHSYHPSVWTHFWGGRRAFFEDARYRQFARHMTYYTYLYRVDEQPVIGAAWALLSDGDRVWYLPERGIHWGVFHHGWVDNREILRTTGDDPNYYEVNTFHNWEIMKEHYDRVMSWDEYLQVAGFRDNVDMCVTATTKRRR